MHVTEPAQFKRLPKKRKYKQRLSWFALFTVFALLFYSVTLYVRPLPPVHAQRVPIKLPASQTVQLAWPGYGQAAIGAQGFGLLATNGTQTPVPTASIAKIVTALAVIKEKPLKSGEQGPAITLTSEDVAAYNQYLNNDGSVVAVQEGEQISEYQALQAMLLPSANNMADTLARWAFGSVDNYIAYANKMVSDLRLNNTHITGASGFEETTTSTATDLVSLGLVAMNEPVLADIVSQQKAIIPVAGNITNVNYALGEEGVNGIKTGNTDQAGGCFLFSAKQKLASGESVTVVGAILGAPTLGAALRDSLPLIKTSFTGFQSTVLLHKNQAVATFDTVWGNMASAVITQEVRKVMWIGQPVTARVTLKELSSPAKTNQPAAEVKLNVGGTEVAVPAYLNQAIENPSLNWRIVRN